MMAGETLTTPLIEVVDCGPAGYVPLVDHVGWRVASLVPAATPHAEPAEVVGRHTKTDEVFVLLQGRVLLVIAGNGLTPKSILTLAMGAGRVYNVRRGTGHTAVLSCDSLVLVVENRDTGAANTESRVLTPAQRSRVAEAWGTLGWMEPRACAGANPADEHPGDNACSAGRSRQVVTGWYAPDTSPR